MKRAMLSTMAAMALIALVLPAGGASRAGLWPAGLESRPTAADLSVAAIIQKHGLSPIEAAAAVVIADALGLDATFVINTGRQTHQPLVLLGPAFVLSRQSRYSVIDIWGRREKGKGWGEIAHELGIHPGTFNKMRVKGDFDRAVWVNLVNQRYGYGPTVISGLEKRGMGTRDWVTACAYSNGDSKRLIVVADNWKNDKSWKNPGGGHGKGGSDKPGKGHGKGPGNGKGQGKGKGHGGGDSS